MPVLGFWSPDRASYLAGTKSRSPWPFGAPLINSSLPHPKPLTSHLVYRSHSSRQNNHRYSFIYNGLSRRIVAIFFLLSAAFWGTGCANPGFIPPDALTTLRSPSHVETYPTGTLDNHPGYGGK